MLSLTFKEKSWHAWIVDHWTPTCATEYNNLCSYFWIVVFGLLVLSLIALFALALVVGFTFDVAWVFGYESFIDPKSKAWEAFSHFHHVWQMCALLTNVCLGLISVFAVIGISCWLAGLAESRTRKIRNYPIKQPGFIKASFLTFKDKVCYKIKFE